MTDEFKREIFDLITDEQLSEAFERLQDGLTPSDPAYIDVATLKRRFRNLEKQVLRDTISKDDASVELGVINEQLMLLVQRLETQVGPEPGVDRPAMNYEPPQPVEERAAREIPTEQPRYQPNARGVQGYGQRVDYSGSPSAKRVELELRLPYGMAYDRCLEAFKRAALPIQVASREQGVIQAKISGNLLTSFGERILCWITGFEGNSTQVVLVADSLNPIMVFDWGRNRKLLNSVLAHLE